MINRKDILDSRLPYWADRSVRMGHNYLYDLGCEQTAQVGWTRTRDRRRQGKTGSDRQDIHERRDEKIIFSAELPSRGQLFAVKAPHSRPKREMVRCSPTVSETNGLLPLAL